MRSSPKVASLVSILMIAVRRWWLVVSLLPLGLLSACNPGLPMLNVGDGSSVARLTGQQAKSMVFAAKTDSGIVFIDLGWTQAEEAVEDALRRLDATAEDVYAVFLTHSHRDHVGGWPAVRNAPFYMGASEVVRFLGEERHLGRLPRWSERLKRSRLPARGEVTVRGFSPDTTFIIGRDTLRTFHVPGHTPGSTAYLFRGVVFAGDALFHPFYGGYQPAHARYSDDADQARESLNALWNRVLLYKPDWICTAHAQCGRLDDDLIREATPEWFESSR